MCCSGVSCKASDQWNEFCACWVVMAVLVPLLVILVSKGKSHLAEQGGMEMKTSEAVAVVVIMATTLAVVVVHFALVGWLHAQYPI